MTPFQKGRPRRADCCPWYIDVPAAAALLFRNRSTREEAGSLRRQRRDSRDTSAPMGGAPASRAYRSRLRSLRAPSPQGEPRRPWQAESGQATVEFVLILGMLVLIMVAIVDFGSILNGQMVVAEAARTGTRRAVVDGGASTGAYQAVRDQLEAGGIAAGTALIEIWPKEATYGTVIHVRVRTEQALHDPLLQLAGRSSIALESEMMGRSERLGER